MRTIGSNRRKAPDEAERSDAPVAFGQPIRVVIAHEHAIFRCGVRGVLGEDPRMRLVGEGCSSHEALDLARLEAPDVVIMDASLSNETGIEATRTIRRELPQTAVVLLATNEDEELLFRAIKAGAAAFFGQDVLPDDLLSGVRRVCQGEYLINDCVLTRPLTASRVLEQFHTLSEAGEEVDSLFIPVSAREIEVLDYIARGYSNKEIARALKISDQTVKNHITSILKKLAVNDRTQAVVYALRHGWINMQQLG